MRKIYYRKKRRYKKKKRGLGFIRQSKQSRFKKTQIGRGECGDAWSEFKGNLSSILGRFG